MEAREQNYRDGAEEHAALCLKLLAKKVSPRSQSFKRFRSICADYVYVTAAWGARQDSFDATNARCKQLEEENERLLSELELHKETLETALGNPHTFNAVCHLIGQTQDLAAALRKQDEERIPF